MAVSITITVADPPRPPEGYEELRIIVRKWRCSDSEFEEDELFEAVDWWIREGLENTGLHALCRKYGPKGLTHTLQCDPTDHDDDGVYQWGAWRDAD